MIKCDFADLGLFLRFYKQIINFIKVGVFNIISFVSGMNMNNTVILVNSIYFSKKTTLNFCAT